MNMAPMPTALGGMPTAVESALSSEKHFSRDPRLVTALEEFDLTIRPALKSGVLPRRNPTEYRFRVTYPPSGILPLWDGDGRGDWICEIPVQRRIAFYVHVPFCLRVCTFCHFSVARLPEANFLSAFVDLLLRELDLWMKALPGDTIVDSIYVGGGTPTALPAQLLNRLLKAVSSTAKPAGSELTVEASPGTLTAEVVGVLKDNDVTRVNLGVQDLNPQMPRLLGRDHSLQEAVHAMNVGTREWPDTLNVDLIFGLPNQSLQNWLDTLCLVQEFGIPSVTVYQLHIAQGTPFRSLWQRQPEMFPDEQTNLIMRWLSHRVFTSAGRVQDPIDWYLASPKARCRHQLGKWGGEVGLVALGPGAYWGSPTIAGRNARLPQWKDAVEKGRIPVAACAPLSRLRSAARYAVFALKTRDGIDSNRYRRYSGEYRDPADVGSMLANADRLLQNESGKLRASQPLGMLRLEEIAQAFFDQETTAELLAAQVSPYSE